MMVCGFFLDRALPFEETDLKSGAKTAFSACRDHVVCDLVTVFVPPRGFFGCGLEFWDTSHLHPSPVITPLTFRLAIVPRHDASPPAGIASRTG
jgi:hypothetical protein